MEHLKIEVASVPHRDNLIAEIWAEDDLIAEINVDGEEPALELYATRQAISLHSFQGALIRGLEGLKKNTE